MRATLVMVVSVMCAVALSSMAVAGSMDSPGLPSAGSGMYSLSQIYDYLNSGTAATTAGSFQEPGEAPGSTMKTTKQIYDDIKAKFDDCEATAADVRSGVHFFSAVPGSWGVQTGSLVAPPTATPTLTPTPTTTPTLTPPPTPTMDMSKIVLIGSMWVAKGTDNAGTDFNASKNWDNAVSWGTGLNWLGRSTGWRLPSKDELSTICASKNLLGGYTNDAYWSSTEVWYVQFRDCGLVSHYKSDGSPSVRAVRDPE
ncbi:MAG: DUF1566 domain-containing protein [Candidatus Aureabacteria bacterium]|nr:DUF1566 domain-containing protein [Candidatus Auribacterota bacterium]